MENELSCFTKVFPGEMLWSHCVKNAVIESDSEFDRYIKKE
jgi:hypothetical protein